jgi:heme/copper-type cytochrome/quinol oxidase subunit 3
MTWNLHLQTNYECQELEIYYVLSSIPFSLQRLVFWHQEVASGPFCLLVNSPWLLIFALIFFFLSLSGFNLYCWKGIHFSWSLDLVFLYLFLGLIVSFHFWFRDLLRELNKKYEVLLMVLFLVFFLFLASEALLFISFFWASFHSLSSPSLGIWPGEGFYVPDPCELTFANTLLLSNAAVSLGGAFVSLEISCSLLIFFSLFSFILAWTFISLQIKEFRIMGLSINDSVYSSAFFFLTGLHFFHLVVGLFLLSLFFWGCSLQSKISNYYSLRVSEVHLFYNLQIFYWHFLEILWLFIFLCLFFMLIVTFHFWFRDLLRELNKKYEILLMVLFLVFFLFLASEALLFISFFWASFHSLSSPSLGIWPGEGFYVPDPCELTFANTLLSSEGLTVPFY